MDNTITKETRLKTFTTKSISKYKKVTPDWHPPHKTFFSTAKQMGMVAVVDEMDEPTFSKHWKKLMEEGHLEGNRIRVELFDRKTGVKVGLLRFESNDLRHLRVLNGKKSS